MDGKMNMHVNECQMKEERKKELHNVYLIWENIVNHSNRTQTYYSEK